MTKEQSTILKIIIVPIIVILGGFFVWRAGLLEPASVKLSNSVLTVAPETFDFGTISMAKGNVETKFTLKNDGEEPLIITDVVTSCMCTTAEIDGKIFGMHVSSAAGIEMPAKSSKEMKVTFDPNAHGPTATGPITRTIDIRTNTDSKISPPKEAIIKGVVVK